MFDLQAIARNYKSMSDEALIQLSNKPEKLRPDVVSILLEELISRDLVIEAQNLTNLIEKSKNKINYKGLPKDELKKLVQERLDNGESVEVIRLDLKEDGLDVFEILDEETKQNDKVLDYIVDLKQKGFDEQVIENKILDNFKIENNDVEKIKIQLRKRGKFNIILGCFIILLSLVLLIANIALGKFYFKVLVVLPIGIWRLIKGINQLK